MRRIEIGLLGLGNVGAGCVRLLQEQRGSVSARLGLEIAIGKIAVRDPKKRREVEVDASLLTTDAKQVVGDPNIRVVVELIGGIEPARSLVLEAIANGKHVVTANKALLAEHGEELFTAADKAGVSLLFEASVCGGVPVIRALREGLAGDRVEALWGIVNGTSNYILTRMTEAGRPFLEVLAEAQKAGYAEADPTLDIEGGDAAHKLAILATLAYGTRVGPKDIFTRGVSHVEPQDLAWADRFGLVVKHLAIAKAHSDSVEVRVHPALVSRSWLLASVGGSTCAVYVRSKALGPSLYYGPGAGGPQTAVAVLSDLFEVCRGLLAFSGSSPPPRAYRATESLPLRDMGELRCRYYLRADVADQPGVLALVAGVLAAHRISIAEVVQERAVEGPAGIVLLTHDALERDVQKARNEIQALASVRARPKLLRIES